MDRDALVDARVSLEEIASIANHRLAALDARGATVSEKVVVLNGDTYDLLQSRAALGIAWAAVEAALPEGSTFSISKTVDVFSGDYVATSDYGEPVAGYAYGPTPVIALSSLATKIRAALLRDPAHQPAPTARK